MDHLDVILSILKQVFKTLNDNGLKVYDAENLDFYISNITYDSEADQLIASFKDGSLEK